MSVLNAPPGPTHELPGTRFTALASPARGTVDTSVWQVEISPGTPPTPHSLTREEVFAVLSGTALVRIGDEHAKAQPGDAIVVPADTPFELSCAGQEPMRALCCLPVGGQAMLADGSTFVPPWAQ
jgi:quercetin dioxygenase-like cupin family protein